MKNERTSVNQSSVRMGRFFMKIEEKKTGRLELRIPADDLELFKIAAYSIGSTPSQLLRMYVNSTLVALKAKQKAGEINLENVKALFNDKL